MCGIAGIIAFNDKGKALFRNSEAAIDTLVNRGPDGQGIYRHNNIILIHTRLSIIDTSNAGAQPFTDASGRYTIVFNGEFFNFREHKKALQDQGIQFKSESDSEVLLYLFIKEGKKCLEKINGFFAFAIYDNVEETVCIARDRIGVKPLLYFKDQDKFIFASEMKALIAFGIPKELDRASLLSYLHLNYIPSPGSIFKGVQKLPAGTFLEIKNSEFKVQNYYQIPYKQSVSVLNYEQAQEKLKELLEESVEKRLIADVPLGAFLSGGIDSSIITAIASRHVKHLNTFSIGFKDEPLFDESHYAELVAKKYNTNHTLFSLSNADLFSNLHKVLDYIDEPFADSSALAVHILSMHTKKHVSVALSGDGADELFAGYHKHRAAYNARHGGMAANLLKWSNPLWEILPKSRNSKLGNKIRQFQKFSHGMQLSPKDRYWLWAGFNSDSEAISMLSGISTEEKKEYNKRKAEILYYISDKEDLNDMLYTDMHLVLQNDMLTKVDLMSMANGLEVRTPFLDFNIVNFAFTLPSAYKIDAHQGKQILKDAFRSYLPKEIYHRRKQGFEVPLLKWFRSELRSMITDDLLSDTFVREQGVFNLNAIQNLKSKLFSNNPDDVVAQIWGLIVFQYWWKKTM